MIARPSIDPAVTRVAGAIASTVPTPFYLLDIGNVRRRFVEFISSWRTCFPDAECAYSYKTNPLPAVTRALRSQGARAEVVSATEFEWAQTDGFYENKIHFNGPAKSEIGLRRSIWLGAVIHIDSLDELDLILKISDRRPLSVVLRTAHPLQCGGWSRFGLLPEECWVAIQRLQTSGVPTMGLHFHVGSNLNTTAHHINALSQNIPLLQYLLTDAGSERKVLLDIGGGFPARSATDSGTVTSPRVFAAAISDVLRASDIDASRLLLISEPGRSLVEDEGVLVTRVVARKVREGRPILIVDAGLDLARSAGAWHHLVSFIGHAAGPAATSYAVYGARCYENDLLPSTACGPDNIEVGALVAVGSAGAYGLTQASVWNGLCAPIFGMDGSILSELERRGRLPELTAPDDSSKHSCH